MVARTLLAFLLGARTLLGTKGIATRSDPTLRGTWACPSLVTSSEHGFYLVLFNFCF